MTQRRMGENLKKSGNMINFRTEEKIPRKRKMLPASGNIGLKLKANAVKNVKGTEAKVTAEAVVEAEGRTVGLKVDLALEQGLGKEVEKRKGGEENFLDLDLVHLRRAQDLGAGVPLVAVQTDL